MKRAIFGIATVTLAVLPLAAQAQFSKPEDAVKYRQSVFALMGAHMGRIGAMVKGQRPFDKAALEQDVAVIDMMSKLPWHAFPSGSTQNSKAKPEVWSEPAKFQAAADKLQGEVQKLSAAARSGDMVQVRAAFGAVGESCKACHTDFRNR